MHHQFSAGYRCRAQEKTGSAQATRSTRSGFTRAFAIERFQSSERVIKDNHLLRRCALLGTKDGSSATWTRQRAVHIQGDDELRPSQTRIQTTELETCNRRKIHATATQDIAIAVKRLQT